MTRRDLTVERLREVLDYDPETGHFTHKRRSEPADATISGRRRAEKVRTWNTRYAGKRAGYLHTPSGYWIICIDDVKYKAHRLAHLWMTGEWPAETVDHRFSKRADNRWTQLRLATNSQTASTRGCGAITPRDALASISTNRSANGARTSPSAAFSGSSATTRTRSRDCYQESSR